MADDILMKAMELQERLRIHRNVGEKQELEKEILAQAPYLISEILKWREYSRLTEAELQFYLAQIAAIEAPVDSWVDASLDVHEWHLGEAAVKIGVKTRRFVMLPPNSKAALSTALHHLTQAKADHVHGVSDLEMAIPVIKEIYERSNCAKKPVPFEADAGT